MELRQVETLDVRTPTAGAMPDTRGRALIRGLREVLWNSAIAEGWCRNNGHGD
jgi:hypothetical protein